MTLHNAKGLEFPLVFLSGMELGLFPHSRSVNSPEALEEERRLCYVGMTRARKRLILTWARYRRRFGGGEQERSTPSWFLSEVPEHLILNLGPQDEPGEVTCTANGTRSGRRPGGTRSRGRPTTRSTTSRRSLASAESRSTVPGFRRESSRNRSHRGRPGRPRRSGSRYPRRRRRCARERGRGR